MERYGLLFAFVQRHGNFGISVATLALESVAKTTMGSCSETEGVLAGPLALADLRMGVTFSHFQSLSLTATSVAITPVPSSCELSTWLHGVRQGDSVTHDKLPQKVLLTRKSAFI